MVARTRGVACFEVTLNELTAGRRQVAIAVNPRMPVSENGVEVQPYGGSPVLRAFGQLPDDHRASHLADASEDVNVGPDPHCPTVPSDRLLTGTTFASSTRAMSQNDHHKLVDVARQIVDEAVRRARVRRNDS